MPTDDVKANLELCTENQVAASAKLQYNLVPLQCLICIPCCVAVKHNRSSYRHFLWMPSDEELVLHLVLLRITQGIFFKLLDIRWSEERWSFEVSHWVMRSMLPFEDAGQAYAVIVLPKIFTTEKSWFFSAPWPEREVEFTRQIRPTISCTIMFRISSPQAFQLTT